MGVIKGDFTETQGAVTITNGDFQALREIAREYGLADETGVIIFALGLLRQAGGRGVTITKSDGVSVELVPAEKLKIVTE